MKTGSLGQSPIGRLADPEVSETACRTLIDANHEPPTSLFFGRAEYLALPVGHG